MKISDKLLQKLVYPVNSESWKAFLEYLEETYKDADDQMYILEGIPLYRLQGKLSLLRDLVNLQKTVSNELKIREDSKGKEK